MKKSGFVEGASSVTYLHKNDEGRHRNRCIYHKYDNSCAYMSHCGGSSQCPFYSEGVVEPVIRTNSCIKNEEVNRDKNFSHEVLGRFSGIQAIKAERITETPDYSSKTFDNEQIAQLLDYYRINQKLNKPVFVTVNGDGYLLRANYLQYYVSRKLNKKHILCMIGTEHEAHRYDKLLTKGTVVRYPTACNTCKHEYDNGVVQTEATCEHEGTKLYTCKLCGKTKTEAIFKLSHTYSSEVTKKPTVNETGVRTYTCKVCGNTYTETIEKIKSSIQVSVTDKVNIPENIHEGRYSNRSEFAFRLVNSSSKSVKGVQGILHVKDLFGKEIISLNCDFSGKTILANGSITFNGIGIDINQFMDNHQKLYNTAYADLQFDYEVSNVVYNGDAIQQNTTTGSSKIVINVTDKYNLPENYSAGRYSARSEFSFSIKNKTTKSIKGVQGVLVIKDMFGDDIISVNCDFTGNTVPANGSVNVSDIGIDINEFMDDHVKLYNEEFSDLTFEYQVTKIVYTDGTSE